MTTERQLTTLAIATTSLVPFLLASCAGGPAAGPSGASVPPPPIIAQDAASAGPAEIDCHAWHSRGNFFALASAELVRECLEAGADPNDPRDYFPAISVAARIATDPAVIGLLIGAGADPNARPQGNPRVVGYRRGYTPLHMAAQWNSNPGFVDALVAAGADLEARDAAGATPLHAAWGNPNPSVVQALLRSGAGPLAQDQSGRFADPTNCANWNTTAFTRHASPDHFELCALAEDVHTYDGNGNTPLHLAAQLDNPAAVAILLEAGADLTAENNGGATPLHLAAIHDGTASLTLLLGGGADIDAGADIQGTPLLHALTRWRGPRGGSSEAAVDALLKAGADINAADSTGNTPLLASMGLQRSLGWPATDLPLRLLALGANPNSRDTQGRTPLYEAASADSPAVIRALLDAGADPQALTNEGASPLHPAAESGSPEVIALLASTGVDPNRLTDGSHAPLHLAVWERRPPRFVVAWYPDAPWRFRAFALLEAGADPNVHTEEGDTPLHLLVSGYQPDTALLSGLARAGADIDARNDSGETPLHVARALHNRQAVRALLNFGADPDARDNAGRLADPVCYWGGGGDRFRGWNFLASSPVESVRGCLESGIPVNARDEEGATPLASMVSALGCCTDFENVLPLFVAAGADVNARDNAGRTPLHRAFGMSGRVPQSVLTGVTSALLEAGADPHARASQGATLLHIARAWAVPLLAAAGGNLDARNGEGETPLHIALRRDDDAKVRALLHLGADTAALDSEGNNADPVNCERWGSGTFFALADADVLAGCTAFGADVRALGRHGPDPLLVRAAAKAQNPGVISVLLEAGAEVHVRDDRYGYTPLHHAARSGTAGVVRALLEAGADPDAWATGFNVDWGWGWTPLHLAARSNPDPDVVRVLAEAGADLEARSGESYRQGNSPLHYAGGNANPDVVAALLDAGADVNALSAAGRTPLHEAAANASNPAVIELLVAAGADVNALDSNGYAPLHSAAWYNHRPEIATSLIAAGADVNARDPDGHVPVGRAANNRTPLFMAVYRGGVFIGGQPMPTSHNVPVVEVLVRAGADLEQADGSGLTPLHAAARWSPAAFPLLLSLGADPTARDENGKTPLDYALANRSLEGLPEVRRMREALRRGRAGR